MCLARFSDATGDEPQHVGVGQQHDPPPSAICPYSRPPAAPPALQRYSRCAWPGSPTPPATNRNTSASASSTTRRLQRSAHSRPALPSEHLLLFLTMRN